MPAQKQRGLFLRGAGLGNIWALKCMREEKVCYIMSLLTQVEPWRVP